MVDFMLYEIQLNFERERKKRLIIPGVGSVRGKHLLSATAVCIKNWCKYFSKTNLQYVAKNLESVLALSFHSRE